MEIKVGDKVRVREDAPKMYFFGCNYDNSVCKVILVDRDNAVITQIKNGSFAIPTKYLIKVDAEKKEAKFNVGDKVVVHYSTGDKMGRIQEVLYDGCYDVNYGEGCTGHHIIESRLYPYTEPTAPTIKVGDMVRCKCPLRLKNSTDNDFIGTVTEVEGGWFRVRMNNGADFQTDHESDLELVQPTEQTETEKKPDIGSIEIPVEVDLTDSYWDAYTADLAKEIALKVANKYSDPKEAADYAVSVAKAVVENLKKE